MQRRKEEGNVLYVNPARHRWKNFSLGCNLITLEFTLKFCSSETFELYSHHRQENPVAQYVNMSQTVAAQDTRVHWVELERCFELMEK